MNDIATKGIYAFSFLACVAAIVILKLSNIEAPDALLLALGVLMPSPLAYKVSKAE